jgi:hypothetical protein
LLASSASCMDKLESLTREQDGIMGASILCSISINLLQSPHNVGVPMVKLFLPHPFGKATPEVSSGATGDRSCARYDQQEWVDHIKLLCHAEATTACWGYPKVRTGSPNTRERETDTFKYTNDVRGD